MHVRPQIGGCTLHSFAGIGKGDESRDALARAAVKSETVRALVKGSGVTPAGRKSLIWSGILRAHGSASL